MKKSKLDTLPVKQEVAKRLATGESQSSIARDYKMNHTSVSRFAQRDDVQKLIREETLKLLDVIPEAVENIKTIVREMKTTSRSDYKNRELSYKASQKVLESAGIMNTPVASQTVVNIIKHEEHYLSPAVEALLTKHLGLTEDETTREVEIRPK